MPPTDQHAAPRSNRGRDHGPPAGVQGRQLGHGPSSSTRGYLSQRGPTQPEPAAPRSRRRRWSRLARSATLAGGAASAAALFVVSAAVQRGHRPAAGAVRRPGRRSPTPRPTAPPSLQEQVAELTQEVRDLTDQVDDDDVRRYQARGRGARGPGRPHPAHGSRRRGHPLRRARGRDRRRRPATRTCWSCTSRTSRPSSTRCGRAAPTAVIAPGPADGHHHRHQVRGQLGGASRACPTRSPTSSRRSATSATLDRAIAADEYLAGLPRAGRRPRHRRRLGPRHRGRASPRRRTTACSTCPTRPRSSRPAPAADSADGR